MKLKKLLLGLSLSVGLAGAAHADTVVLNFENIVPSGQQYTSIGNYYAALGVTFSQNALAVCLNTTTVACSNGSRGGQGDPTSQLGALFFLSGSETYVNYASGFTDGFSFFYTAVNQTGSIDVYSGLGGTGDLLATLVLPLTPSNCSPSYNAGFCPFVPIGVSFSGTAQSISFGGVANQIGFDDVTFGSAIPNPPNPIPEPSTLVMLLTGVGAAGTQIRRRILAARA